MSAQDVSSHFAFLTRGNPFATEADPNAVVTYNNPIIPGFYSDPSVCRVGDVYSEIETVGFFTGVYVGFYATGNGKVSTTNADYDWFEYVVNEPPRGR